ncbi:MAG: hypothetical protein ACREK5_06375 [Gemmatimonadota bacterium]
MVPEKRVNLEIPAKDDLLTNTSFGLGLSNIPLVNLRWEFRDTYLWLQEPSTVAAFASKTVQPIEMPWLIWGRMPQDLLTLLLQRMILGMEAYLEGALVHTGMERGMDSSFMDGLREVLKRRQTARSYYMEAPSLVDPPLSLESHDQPLYKRVHAFYREVRNPLFHGRMINSRGPIEVLGCFEVFRRVYYDWIDTWFHPDKVIPGLAASVTIESPPD